MKFPNIFRRNKIDKEITDDSKYVEANVSTIKGQFIMPRFNRHVAVRSYTGYFAAAIDYNSNAAASGVLRLFSKTSRNGQKCLYNTYKYKDPYLNDFFTGKLEDKVSSDIQSKIMDSVEDFEIVQGHPITELFRKANSTQSMYQLFFEIYLNLEITGDSFVHVVSFPDGTPSQLYVLQSQHIDIIPGSKNSGKLIERYDYKRNSGHTVKFTPDEIIHIKYPNPEDFWYGKGKVEKGWQSFLLNKFSHDYQIALYANNGVPDYLLINKSGDKISKKRFEKNMKNITRGAANRGKVLAVNGDVEIKTVAFQPKDLSDVKFNITEIASITGVPVDLLLGASPTASNSKQDHITWLRWTVHPMQKLVASALTEGLLYRYNIKDGDAFLMYDNPVPQDIEAKRKSDETYAKIGVLTSNEIRVSMGKNKLGETLDEVYFNGNKLGENNSTNNQSNNDDSKFVKDKTMDKEFKFKLDSIVKDIDINKELLKLSINKNNKEQQPVNVNIYNTEEEEEEIEEEKK